MKPRSKVKVTGRVISTEKVPARMIPALVITGPVAASARSMPSRVPCCARLLAHPRHQEDRVVDPQRDQEDEGEGRDRGVDAGVADDEADEQDRDPERAEEREDHARDQHQRRDQRPQQDREDDRDQQQRERRDQLEVALDRLVEVVVDRGRRRRPARSPRAPGRRRRRGARARCSSDSDLSGSSSSIDVDRGGAAVRRRCSPVGVGAGDAVHALELADRLGDVGLGDRAVLAASTSTVVGASVPCGKPRPSTSKPSTLSTDFLKKRRGRVVDLVGEQAERAGDEDGDGDEQRRHADARGPCRRPAARRPGAALGGVLGVVVDRAAPRPEPAPAEDRQQRRQQGQPGDHRA